MQTETKTESGQCCEEKREDVNCSVNIIERVKAFARGSSWFLTILLLCLLCYLLGAMVQHNVDSKNVNEWLLNVPDPIEQLPDRVSVEQINVQFNKLTLTGAFTVSGFENTDSMLPIMDYGSNGIYVAYTPDIHLQVGDIVSYYSSRLNATVAHRIVDMGQDRLGAYYVTKGDNLVSRDPQVLREGDIKRVLVGVLW